jgi:hypothetical protein
LLCWRRAARNGSRHGNAICGEFDERLDIIPRNVQMNVATGVLDANSVFLANSEGLTLA